MLPIAHSRSGFGGLWVTILLPVLAFVMLAAWSVASPVGSSPDDDYHMASIWCGLGERDGLCEPGDEADERRVPNIVIESAECFAFQRDVAASCPIDEPSSLSSTDRGNFADDGYPPVYYATMAVFASNDVATSVVVMRLVNSALFVGIIGALAASVGQRIRRPLLLSSLVALVPLGFFIVASVNPSSWAVLSALGLWAALLGWYRRRSAARSAVLAVLAVVLTVMGAGARADSAVYNGVAVLIAMTLAFERSRAFALRSLLPMLVLAISLAFFFTSGQSGVVVPQALDDEVNVRALLLLNAVGLPELWHGVFGTWGLGWTDTPMPGSVWVLAGGVFAAFIFLGVRTLPLRKAIAMAIAVGSLVAVPFYILMRDGVLDGGFVQPRYILPLVILTVAVALVGSTEGAWLSRTQAAVAATLLAVANGTALFVNIRRYVTGLDVVDWNLDRRIEWWWDLPFGPMPVLIVGTVAFAVAASVLMAAVRGGSAPSEGPRRDGGDGHMRREDRRPLSSGIRTPLD